VICTRRATSHDENAAAERVAGFKLADRRKSPVSRAARAPRQNVAVITRSPVHQTDRMSAIADHVHETAE